MEFDTKTERENSRNLFELGEFLAILDPHGVLPPIPMTLFVVAQSDPSSSNLLQSLVRFHLTQLHQHLLREQLVPRTGTAQQLHVGCGDAAMLEVYFMEV